MGWGYGTNKDGREVGYSVDAECDAPDCTTEIDRGVAYVCGGMHDGGELGCGGYFCAEHLFHGVTVIGDALEFSQQLCATCIAAVSESDEDGSEGA